MSVPAMSSPLNPHFSMPYAIHTIPNGQHMNGTHVDNASTLVDVAAWTSSYHPSSGISPSSTTHPPLYPILPPARMDFSSPTPPGSTTSYTDNGGPACMPLSPEIPSHDIGGSQFAQIDSSIGPNRLRTRGQRRAQTSTSLIRRISAPSQISLAQESGENSPGSSHYHSSPARSPRPLTPIAISDRLNNPTDQESLSSASSSLPAHPASFPISQSYLGSHSRSNSMSSISLPRSISPALSVVSSASVPAAQKSPPYPSASNDRTPQASVRPKQRKQRLYNLDRRAICVFAAENPNTRQEDIAQRYGVERSTISKILKNKTKWLNIPADEVNKIAKHRPSKFPEIEDEMLGWLVRTHTTQTYSDQAIRNKAKEIANALEIPEDKFKASSGWIENFKHRHGIRQGIWTGEGKNHANARAMGAGGPPPMMPPQLEPLHSPTAGPSRGTQFDSHHPPRGSGPGIMERDTSVQLRPTFRPAWGESNIAPEMPHQNHVPQMQSEDMSHHMESEHRSDMLPMPVSMYGPMEPMQDNHPPTMPEAELHMNKVMDFFDRVRPDILTGEERRILGVIKCALFQAASGIPFNRDDSGFRATL